MTGSGSARPSRVSSRTLHGTCGRGGFDRRNPVRRRLRPPFHPPPGAAGPGAAGNARRISWSTGRWSVGTCGRNGLPKGRPRRRERPGSGRRPDSGQCGSRQFRGAFLKARSGRCMSPLIFSGTPAGWPMKAGSRRQKSSPRTSCRGDGKVRGSGDRSD